MTDNAPSHGLHKLGPRHVAQLFLPLQGELLTMLRALSPTDWDRPTVAGPWLVRDVVAHLLDGELRKVSVFRDDHQLPAESPITDAGDLAKFINQVNATGVAFSRRLSPRVMVDLLEISGGWAASVVAALDPYAPSRWPVSWAGEAQSANWMDTGREYTERWHHQAQIRDAVGAEQLLAPRWFEPLLDFSARALPVAYANRTAAAGTSITLGVTGETTAHWTLVREESHWGLFAGTVPAPDASATLSADDFWRLFYNALDRDTAARAISVDGDATLIDPLLSVRSVIV